ASAQVAGKPGEGIESRVELGAANPGRAPGGPGGRFTGAVVQIGAGAHSNRPTIRAAADGRCARTVSFETTPTEAADRPGPAGSIPPTGPDGTVAGRCLRGAGLPARGFAGRSA